MEKRRGVSVVTIFLVIFTLLPLHSDSVDLNGMSRAITNSWGSMYPSRTNIPEDSTESTITAVPQPPLGSTGPGSLYLSQSQFHNRMARITDDPPLTKVLNKASIPIKWKKSKKIHRVRTTPNTFTNHQLSALASNNSFANDSISPLPPPPLRGSLPPPTLQSQVYSIGRGISNIMTEILTRKFMRLLDRDMPPGAIVPMKHLVASGNEMVEYWDQQRNSRNEKALGVVELLGYGLDHLKRLRDGDTIKASDPVANLTSPAETIIQGLVTMKRLSKRMLRYDRNEVGARGHGHESYGGYGGGHMGGYGHGHGGLYGGLDPFSIIAALAFAAFLLQVLITILNNTARSMNSVTFNNPFGMRDYYLSHLMNSSTPFLGTQTVRTKRSVPAPPEEELFDAILDKVHGVYQTYTQISRSPKCARIYMCRLAKNDFETEDKNVLSPIYMYGIERLGKEKDPRRFLQSVKDRLANGEKLDCDKIVPGCSSK